MLWAEQISTVKDLEFMDANMILKLVLRPVEVGSAYTQSALCAYLIHIKRANEPRK